jgi:hypothetical protein
MDWFGFCQTYQYSDLPRIRNVQLCKAVAPKKNIPGKIELPKKLQQQASKVDSKMPKNPTTGAYTATAWAADQSSSFS